MDGYTAALAATAEVLELAPVAIGIGPAAVLLSADPPAEPHYFAVVEVSAAE